MALPLTLDLLNSKPLDSRFHGNDGQDLAVVVTGISFVPRMTVKALNNYEKFNAVVKRETKKHV